MVEKSAKDGREGKEEKKGTGEQASKQCKGVEEGRTSKKNSSRCKGSGECENDDGKEERMKVKGRSRPGKKKGVKGPVNLMASSGIQIPLRFEEQHAKYCHLSKFTPNRQGEAYGQNYCLQ